MTRSIRKLHRCLGVFIGLQILFWTISGLYFSWNEIKTVRGENLVVKQSGLFLDDPAYVSPSKVISTFVQQNLEIEMIDQVTLRFLLDKPVYEIRYQQKGRVRYALANAFTGLLRSPIRKDEAVAIAHADFEPIAPVLSTDWIEAVKPGSEYRGRPLPAYRITFDHPIETRIYVSAERGLVMARRNSTWRIFDFLWMLHIMDYEDRDNFNNIILQGISVLGVVTVFSGFLLWGTTSPLLRRRIRKRNMIKTT